MTALIAGGPMTNSEELIHMEGKVAIVTGAGRGIGRGISEVFAKAGADVVVAERDPKTANETKGIVEQLGRQAMVAITDVTDETSIDAMLKTALDAFGTVDILVNNVGGVIGKPRMVPIVEMTREYWDIVVELNLTSQFLCCRALITYWVNNDKPGNIVNIASLGGQVPYKTSVAYGAAKAGVINLTASLGAQYGKNNIRVNCISPGHVKTPMTDELYRSRQELRAAQDRIIPLSRYGLPEDLGKAVLFMASDLSSYVTGQTLLVSGGMYYFLTELP
jgi:3-oxoacyl-[acyl-carrier protein] reductase